MQLNQPELKATATVSCGFVAYENNGSVGLKDNNVPFFVFSSRPKSETDQQSPPISTSNS